MGSARERGGGGKEGSSRKQLLLTFRSVPETLIYNTKGGHLGQLRCWEHIAGTGSISGGHAGVSRQKLAPLFHPHILYPHFPSNPHSAQLFC